MRIIADLHLHSKFSRAVSRDMTIPNIALWAERKGIDLVATGDFTHPRWLEEISSTLSENGTGILSLKEPIAGEQGKQSKPRFLLSTEISTIYKYQGKTRRIHTLLWVPTIASARAIGQALTQAGCNLLSDGRPIIGLTLVQLSELIFSVEPNALIVPAHIWTPWFSVYGAMGGFQSLQEAFGPYANRIYAVETGLSSSPDMNWRISELDKRAIVSFSDAHSGTKLGREATVFSLPMLTFDSLTDALKNSTKHHAYHDDTAAHIASTIEFYPEEGKYHYTGHRDCGVRYTPEKALKKGITCPVCGKPLTQGVMARVEDMSKQHEVKVQERMHDGIRWLFEENSGRPPFCMLVPLIEIIAESIGSPVTSKKTIAWYERLVSLFGSEFSVLLHTPTQDILHASTEDIAEGISRVRMGKIHIDPGYDGVFGVVKIWKDDDDAPLVDGSREQISIF